MRSPDNSLITRSKLSRTSDRRRPSLRVTARWSSPAGVRVSTARHCSPPGDCRESTVLVDADWVQVHLYDPGVVLAEVDEDTTAYHKGHIKGAVKIDWKEDLQDPVRRDFVSRSGFEA